MKLTKEDILKYGTKEEIIFLKEDQDEYELGETHEDAEDVFKDKEYEVKGEKFNKLDFVTEWRIQKNGILSKMRIFQTRDFKTKKEDVVYAGGTKGGEKYIRDEILGEARNPMQGYVNPNMFPSYRKK